MINKISSEHTSFKAKYIPCQKELNIRSMSLVKSRSKAICHEFEQLTKKYPKYTLLQKESGFVDKDCFVLLKDGVQNPVSEGNYDFTNKLPRSIDLMAYRLVDIFEDLMAKK